MTRSIFALLALTVAACDADSTALPVDEAPPVAGYDNFVVGDMLASTPTKVSWEDAALVPGTTARLFLSPNGTGAGPCPPVLGGQCAGLNLPMRQIATATVQPGYSFVGAASGATYTVDNYVIFDVTPPANLPNFITFGMQAAAPDGAGSWTLSPAVVAESGPGFCSFIFMPVCGIDHDLGGTAYSNDCIAASAGMVVVSEGFDCP